MKKVIANVAACVVISPVLPFYVMCVIAERSALWYWPDYFVDKAERIWEWGKR